MKTYDHLNWLRNLNSKGKLKQNIMQRICSSWKLTELKKLIIKTSKLYICRYWNFPFILIFLCFVFILLVPANLNKINLPEGIIAGRGPPFQNQIKIRRRFKCWYKTNSACKVEQFFIILYYNTIHDFKLIRSRFINKNNNSRVSIIGKINLKLSFM